MKNKIILSIVAGAAIMCLASVSSTVNAQWLTSGSNVYLPTPGKVGIGTQTPQYSLDVQSSSATSFIRSKSTANSAALVLDRASNTKGTNVFFRTNGINSWTLGCPSAAAGSSAFQLTNASGIAALYVDSTTNNVGIGTSTPLTRLTIKDQSASTVNIGSVFPSNYDYVGLNMNGNITANTYNILSGTADQSLFLNRPAGFPMYFSENGTDRQLYIASGGNVGIGTTAPSSKLHIYSNNQANAIYSENQYNGSTDAIAVRALANNPGSGNSTGGYFIGSGAGGTNYGVHGDATGGAINYGVYGYASGTGTNWAGYFSGGNVYIANNVGIGTTTPAFKLDVCGPMRAKEILVSTGWCDYVFANDYKLPDLSDVEAYIKENKHLPEVTAGPEIESNGLEVGKVSSQMIKKIEELTLYVIELQKQVDKLKAAK